MPSAANAAASSGEPAAELSQSVSKAKLLSTAFPFKDYQRAKLSVAAGGVVFTIQKFFPEERGDCHPILSERRNIVVIADEADRS